MVVVVVTILHSVNSSLYKGKVIHCDEDKQLVQNNGIDEEFCKNQHEIASQKAEKNTH